MSFILSNHERPSLPVIWSISIVLVTILFAALSLLHLQEIEQLIAWWGTTSKDGHSLLVFPMIVYLIAQRRKELSQLVPAPEPILLLVIIFQVAALSAFYFINVRMLSETILLSMYPTLLWLILGRETVKVIFVPLLLLMTLAPVWELVEPVLTYVTASAAHIGLQLLNVPVFRDAHYLTIPEGVFLIEEGCGGFRYFIVGLTLGLIHAYLNFSGLKRRAIVVAFAVALSVCANWVRVLIVIWAGHKTNMEHHFVTAHVKLGWYVFAVAFLLYFIATSRFSHSPVSKADHLSRGSSPGKPRIKYQGAVFCLALVSIFAIPHLLVTTNSTGSEPRNEVPALQALMQVEGWSESATYTGSWSPYFRGATDESTLTYRKGSFSVDFYVAYYLEQSHENEMVNFYHTVINEEWRLHDESATQLDIDQYGVVSAKKIIANSAEGQQTVWTWYYVAGSETVSARTAKLLELKKLLGGNSVSAVFAMLPSGGANDEETQRLTERLLDRLYPQIIEAFDNL